MANLRNLLDTFSKLSVNRTKKGKFKLKVKSKSNESPAPSFKAGCKKFISSLTTTHAHTQRKTTSKGSTDVPFLPPYDKKKNPLRLRFNLPLAGKSNLKSKAKHLIAAPIVPSRPAVAIVKSSADAEAFDSDDDMDCESPDVDDDVDYELPDVFVLDEPLDLEFLDRLYNLSIEDGSESMIIDLTEEVVSNAAMNIDDADIKMSSPVIRSDVDDAMSLDGIQNMALPQFPPSSDYFFPPGLSPRSSWARQPVRNVLASAFVEPFPAPTLVDHPMCFSEADVSDSSCSTDVRTSVVSPSLSPAVNEFPQHMGQVAVVVPQTPLCESINRLHIKDERKRRVVAEVGTPSKIGRSDRFFQRRKSSPYGREGRRLPLLDHVLTDSEYATEAKADGGLDHKELARWLSVGKTNQPEVVTTEIDRTFQQSDKESDVPRTPPPACDGDVDAFLSTVLDVVNEHNLNAICGSLGSLDFLY
ncbi:hypothetical protein BC835DRAFT_179990 [Cytidiella melzeri]|nr:hypothetical protein BC835DRAFT_670447 [Cytidiella melzeri]KAI0701834.1 hypothetical protein BC835DRAFT_179990 [Cytidiella melzeri]